VITMRILHVPCLCVAASLVIAMGDARSEEWLNKNGSKWLGHKIDEKTFKTCEGTVMFISGGTIESAGDRKCKPGKDKGIATYPGGKTHEIVASVVSVDKKAETITFADDKGENHTAPLRGIAIEQAKSLKPGDRITVTDQDNEQGEHVGIISIKKG